MDRLKSSIEVAVLRTPIKNEVLLVIKRLGSKFILNTMDVEQVVDALCLIDASLQTADEEEIKRVIAQITESFEGTEASVQGEVCTASSKPKK